MENISVFAAIICFKFKPMFDTQRFNNWKRLQRKTAYCFLFNENIKRKMKKLPMLGLQLSHLAKEHFLVIKTAQRQDIVHEISNLQKKKAIESKNPPCTLAHFLVELAILRPRGRRTRAPLLLSVRYPIILAGDNSINRRYYEICTFLILTAKTTYQRPIKQKLLNCVIIHNCIPRRRMQQRVDYLGITDLSIKMLSSTNHYLFAIIELGYVEPFPIVLQGKQ